mmetsp:Transcript_31100/g.76168  ORF Transcript_31100/g.76168 Transcript_31100/m.76168 type:complete len:242 (-) Transcript_31100:587-1312(-)
MNGCRSSSVAVGRKLGSNSQHDVTNATSCDERRCGLASVAPRVVMRLNVFERESFQYGGSPSAISITVMPSDHMSTPYEYGRPRIISGASQCAVPTQVMRRRRSVWLEYLVAKPKSAILTCLPSALISMLSLFTSRCMRHLLCMCASACSVSRDTNAMVASSRTGRRLVSEPPPMCSSTIHRRPSCTMLKHSLSSTTFLCDDTLWLAISWMRYLNVFSPILTTFTATFSLVRTSTAVHTLL